MRTVIQIKSNHKYIPVDRQERFQALIRIILNQNLSDDEFNTTLCLIVNKFPNTNRWVKWHLDNIDGPLIFPSISKGFISGFGRDTHGHKGISEWIQRSYGTSKLKLIEDLEHLAIYGK
jgi:hypothetical protein